MKSYYYINRVNGGKSTVKHPNLHAAHVESLRLSAQYPGEAFEILLCIGKTQTVKPSTFWFDGVNPFHGGFET